MVIQFNDTCINAIDHARASYCVTKLSAAMMLCWQYLVLHFWRCAQNHEPPYLARVQCVNSLRPSPPYMGQWLGSSLVRVIAVHLFGTRALRNLTKKYCQLDPKWQISVNFQSNHNVIFIQGNTLNGKCLHGHFVPAWCVTYFERIVQYLCELRLRAFPYLFVTMPM